MELNIQKEALKIKNMCIFVTKNRKLLYYIATSNGVFIKKFACRLQDNNKIALVL